jgi:hypothetical protein
MLILSRYKGPNLGGNGRVIKLPFLRHSAYLVGRLFREKEIPIAKKKTQNRRILLIEEERISRCSCRLGGRLDRWMQPIAGEFAEVVYHAE